MQLICLSPTSFASNCYLATSGNAAYVIDPAVPVEQILNALREHDLVCLGIVLTHGHFDHMLSLDALTDALPDAPVMIHASDAENLLDGEKNAFRTFFAYDRTFPRADKLLKEGDRLPLGEEYLTVVHTPGHTKGSICLLSSEKDVLVSGDTLFAQGYGRYDLYGGDPTALFASLRRLSALRSDALTLAPGHGEMSSLSQALDALGL